MKLNAFRFHALYKRTSIVRVYVSLVVPFFLIEIMVTVIITLQLRLWSNFFSNTIYFVCINFIHSILFKVNFERQIFGKLYRFRQIYLLLELLPEQSRQKNIFSYFWCRCLPKGLNRGLISSMLTNYLFIFNKNIG